MCVFCVLLSLMLFIMYELTTACPFIAAAASNWTKLNGQQIGVVNFIQAISSDIHRNYSINRIMMIVILM